MVEIILFFQKRSSIYCRESGSSCPLTPLVSKRGTASVLATLLSSQRNKQRPPSEEVKLFLTVQGFQQALPGEFGQRASHEAQLEAGLDVGCGCRIPGPHSLRAFLGRQPLCGMGVLSVIEITSRPPMVRPLMADWKEQEEQEDGMDQRQCPGVSRQGSERDGGWGGAGSDAYNPIPSKRLPTNPSPRPQRCPGPQSHLPRPTLHFTI